MTSLLDTIRCLHCDAIVALLPAARLKGRAVIDCPICGVPRVIRPPDKSHLDVTPRRAYTEAVPA